MLRPGTKQPAAETERFVSQVPLFAALPRRARRHLASASRWVHVAGGEHLFRQGDAPDGMALVWSGRLEAVVEDGGEHQRVGVLAHGSWVGELALLTGAPRSASIRALRDSELLFVPTDVFERLVQREPEVALDIARALAAQLQRRQPVATGPHLPDTFCVLPLGDDLPLDRFLARVPQALQRWGPVAIVDEHGIDAIDPARPPAADLGGDATVHRWAARLDRLESEHPLVFLVVRDPLANPEWAGFCTRSSDRVVVMLRGGKPPAWAESGSLALRGRDLVFVGSDATAPRADAARATLAPRAHHFLPETDDFDGAADRIARRLTGHALGIVFSGGGARGLAHIGVLEELVGAGACIDRLGGCSAGAMAAAMFAIGLSPGRMLEVCREELAERNPFTDFTVPRQSLIKGRKVGAMLTRIFGEQRIEELTLPMFAVSADLASGELFVHRAGELRDVLAASMCIPGFAPPVRLDSRLLVDGGLLDNFPVDVMALSDEGPVVGIDVMRHFPGSEIDDLGVPAPPADGGREERRERDGSVSIVSTLARAMVLGGWQRTKSNRERADLLIEPDVDDIGLFDFDRIDDAYEAGRRAAAEALEAGLPT